MALPHVTCPACGGRAHARAVGKHSTLYRELYYRCRNPDACAYEFVVEMVAVRALKAPRIPNPLHILPMTSWRAAAKRRAADNDDGPDHEPAATAVAT